MKIYHSIAHLPFRADGEMNASPRLLEAPTKKSSNATQP